MHQSHARVSSPPATPLPSSLPPSAPPLSPLKPVAPEPWRRGQTLRVLGRQGAQRSPLTGAHTPRGYLVRPGQQAAALQRREAQEVLAPAWGLPASAPPPRPPHLWPPPGQAHGKPSPAQLTSSCVMESEGDEGRKLPPGVWGLSGGRGPEAWRGESGVTDGAWLQGGARGGRGGGLGGGWRGRPGRASALPWGRAVASPRPEARGPRPGTRQPSPELPSVFQGQTSERDEKPQPRGRGRRGSDQRQSLLAFGSRRRRRRCPGL